MLSGKKILYLAAAIFLSLPIVSCRTSSNNTHTYRPYDERRNRSGSFSDDGTNTTRSKENKNIINKTNKLIVKTITS